MAPLFWHNQLTMIKLSKKKKEKRDHLKFVLSKGMYGDKLITESQLESITFCPAATCFCSGNRKENNHIESKMMKAKVRLLFARACAFLSH